MIFTTIPPVIADPIPALSKPLIAGQNTIAGTVEIHWEPGFIVVKYTVKPDYRLTEMHLAFGESIEDFPLTNKGNPKLGKFPYRVELETPVIGHKFKIPWNNPELPNIWSAHAVIIGVGENAEFEEETAWGKGPSFPGDSWAMFMTIGEPILKIGPSFDKPDYVVLDGTLEHIHVWNDGTGVAHNVELFMEIPSSDGSLVFAITPIGGTWEEVSPNTIKWKLGDIPPGNFVGANFIVLVHRTGSYEMTITAIASETSMTIHPTINLV